ncbi:hypothetical protein NOLU111490_14865 [Novosphingobium lubricantis]
MAGRGQNGDEKRELPTAVRFTENATAASGTTVAAVPDGCLAIERGITAKPPGSAHPCRIKRYAARPNSDVKQPKTRCDERDVAACAFAAVTAIARNRHDRRPIAAAPASSAKPACRKIIDEDGQLRSIAVNAQIDTTATAETAGATVTVEDRIPASTATPDCGKKRRYQIGIAGISAA